LWLLENLPKLDGGVLSARVNFLRKEATIDFDGQRTSLRRIAELLAGIGYEPDFSEPGDDAARKAVVSRMLYVKLGVAAFCFGNIMLIALPEYLSGGQLDTDFRRFFGWLSILLAVPVLYSLGDFFRGAWVSLRECSVTMDVPISIGVLSLAVRSLYDILTGSGPGYFDSLAGLAFFLLLGKVFQQKAFYALSFDRNYRSYFPIAVVRREGTAERMVPLENVVEGDVLRIRHGELIPADSKLLSPEALIDYSFVTGESEPVRVLHGERLYAGGRQVGGLLEMRVVRTVSASYLTQLWDREAFTNASSSVIRSLSETTAKYFTAAILLIASAAAVYWLLAGGVSPIAVAVSVLIVACGCGLPLSLPFAYGTALRVLEKQRVFLKNDRVVERLAGVDTIVLDKTGTLTRTTGGRIVYEGNPLSPREQQWVRSVVRLSAHPLSRQVYEALPADDLWAVSSFEEIPGCGIQGVVDRHRIRLGSLVWLKGDRDLPMADRNFDTDRRTGTYVSVDGVVVGRFGIQAPQRSGIERVARTLGGRYRFVVLSGDNERERSLLNSVLPVNTEYHFNQLPMDKLAYIETIQKAGRTVLMIGDGLNDAGALRQSDVGIAVTENTASFTPGSDAIMDADALPRLPEVMLLAKGARRVVMAAFALVGLYNLVAVGLAVQGQLSPLAAAIVMPLSSISVVAWTVGAVSVYARSLGMR
jgi:Cu+-exporting ATPase